MRLLTQLPKILSRRLQILRSHHVPLRARLKTVMSRSAESARIIEPLIRKEAGRLSVEIAGFRFQVPCPADAEGQALAFRGLSQVVAETFVDPVIFRGKVRLRQGDIILDLGANIGTTAALFSGLTGPKGRVYAFEPGTDDLLKNHVAMNRLGNVEVIAAAVGDREGAVELSMSAFGLDSTVLGKPDWHIGAKSVPLLSLDRFIQDRQLERVDFVKMDIEGAEEQALEGARELIRRFRPRWTISSYHTDALGEKQHPKLVRFLKSAGYRVEEIPGFHIFAW